MINFCNLFDIKVSAMKRSCDYFLPTLNHISLDYQDEICFNCINHVLKNEKIKI